MADDDKRTILVAVDGSKHSESALRWFLREIRKPNDKVVLAYCAEHAGSFPPMTSLDTNPTFAIDIENDQQKIMRENWQKVTDLARSHKLEQNVQQLGGHPGEAIVKAAAEQKADMIVCGSRGQGLFRRTILGSVSDYVLHHTHLPVVVCKHDDEHHKLLGSTPGESSWFT